MELRARQLGEGSALVILHGLLGSSDNWLSPARRLAKRFRVCLFDLRNHGGSPHSDSMTLEELAGDVAESLDAAGISRVHLLGHSLGGKVAMEFALRHPDRVNGLAIIDIAPKAYQPRHVRLMQALLALDLSSFRNRTEVIRALEPAAPALPFRQWLAKNLETDSSGGLKWKVNLPALLRNYPALTGAVRGGRQFHGRTLLLRGGKSDYVRNEDETLAREHFPKLEMRTIEGAGHWLHAEASGEFLESCEAFFAGGEGGLSAEP
jgi:esterase